MTKNKESEFETIKRLKEAYLPNSLEDENFIISLMFHNVDRAERIINQAELEDFFNEFNKRVFKVGVSLTDAGLVITAHSLAQEIDREIDLEEGIPYDIPNSLEISRRYQKEKEEKNIDALPGALLRLKKDRAYRDIIYRANDALLMARSREGEPGAILAPLEELSNDLQKQSGSSVIIWADEAERQAQATYEAMDKGEMIATPTGYPEIDKKLYGGGTWDGDLVIVSGVTSGGKTTFALNLSANAGEAGIPNLYFTMEMSVFRIFSRQHSSRAKVPGYKIRPRMTELYPDLNIRQRLYDTGADMAKRPIGYIEGVRDMETVRRIVKFAAREYGVKQVTLDYLGMMSPSKRFKGSPYERMSIVAEQAKELATDTKTSVIALSQLRRKSSNEKQAGGGDADGNSVEPTLDMLKNSGELENYADTVLFLWGEKGKEGEEDAIRHINGRVAKQRNGVLFPFELKFAPSIYTFSSIERLAELRRKMEEVEF